MQHLHSHTADRVRWGSIALAASAVIGLGAGVVTAEDQTSITPPPTLGTGFDTIGVCVRGGSTSADQLETRSQACQLEIDDLLGDPAFRACLDTARRSADGIERWFDRCRIIVRR